MNDLVVVPEPIIAPDVNHPDAKVPIQSAVALIAATLALAACGGGSDEGTPVVGSAPTPGPAPAPIAVLPTAKQAARFLQMSSLGATTADIASLQTKSFEAWVEEQFVLPRTTSHWDWLTANGFGLDADKFNRSPMDYSIWRKLVTSTDQLRQRMTFALSQIMVIGLDGVTGSWPHFSSAAYVDILEENAFGNFRVLLEKVTLSPAMGIYLSHRGNKKEDPATGRLPDENYAREVMQLFTIGLYELNNDGSLKLQGGNTIESYDQSDVTGLARVFTGWDYDTAVPNTSIERNRLPMRLVTNNHSNSAKVFLTANIPTNINGTESLRIALDTLFNHPNVGPFFGRQLIQRLVTSNPSAAYINRVATAFNNTAGIRGDLKATIKAVLLDPEALTPPVTNTGKLLEPVLRMTTWARAFGVTSPSNKWAENTSDPSRSLGQSPLRSSSVFNFFRPGYVPPSTSIGVQGLVAPELQITHETSVAGYLNYIQGVVSRGNANLVPNYDEWLAKVGDLDLLLNELNTLLTANRLSTATLTIIKGGVQNMAAVTDTEKRNRLYATIVMVLSAPEFIAFI